MAITAPNAETRMTEKEKADAKRKEQAKQFRSTATATAMSLLTQWVGPDRAKEATGRIATAIASSAASAKDPDAFYACTPASVANAVAVSALTGIMPGTGAGALAYVYPRAPRQGAQPLLLYQLSHRGCNALARRCGQTMIAIPISKKDEIEVDDSGDVHIINRDIDNPPTKYDELRGVMVIVKQLNSGLTIMRGWVPKTLIDKRKAVSTSASSDKSPWHNWPVEQAMKTAMHYAINRGWCVIDDTEAVRALSIDADNDFDGQTINGSVSGRGLQTKEVPSYDAPIDGPDEEPGPDPAKKAIEDRSAIETLEADFRRMINEAGSNPTALKKVRTLAQSNQVFPEDIRAGLLGDIDEFLQIARVGNENDHAPYRTGN
ncbi:MAG: recombinase RecT [Planctomycetaceae bacterium]